MSVDFPVHTTCKPTNTCLQKCYALSGFMTYNNAVRCQARNYSLVQSLVGSKLKEVREVADALYADLLKGTSWLRWNGAGDLTLGAVRVINSFTKRHPDVALWVTTRRTDMSALLQDRASLYIMFSVDNSTPAKELEAMREQRARFKRASVRLSYFRIADNDVPPVGQDAPFVVFNLHRAGKRNDWPHKAVCHATLPGEAHEGSCDACRRCFT